MRKSLNSEGSLQSVELITVGEVGEVITERLTQTKGQGTLDQRRHWDIWGMDFSGLCKLYLKRNRNLQVFSA